MSEEPGQTYMRYYEFGKAAGVEAGVQLGAAIAFGLMGMAVAIDEGFAWCPACQSWKLDCTCPSVYAQQTSVAPKEKP